MARAHIYICGHVQGVFYRQTAAEQARSLGVTGWIRNLADGRVEAMAEGPREAVEAFTGWCHEGSARAVVERVDVMWAPKDEGFSDFQVKR